MILQSYNDLLGKFGDLESNVTKFALTEQGSVRDYFDKFRSTITLNMTNIERLGSVEPIKDLSLIGNGMVYEHSSYLDPNLTKFAGNLDNDVIIRLQGAFRSLERENQLLKDKYIQWQSNLHHESHDHDVIINELQRKIVDLTSEINHFRSQASVSVNVSGNTEAYERQIRTLNDRIKELEGRLRQSSTSTTSNVQEYEIKIRTLNSKIQELESQLRTSKVEFDGKIRNKDKYIGELEDKVKLLEERSSVISKGGDSRATGVANTSYTPSSYSSSVQDRMSSSQHSATGSEASDSQVSDRSGARQYGNYTTSTYSRQGNTVQGGNSGLSGSGASYGQQGSLSGSGASYGQQGGYTRTYQASGTTNVVQGSGSGATYGGQQGSSTSGTTSGYTRTYGSTGGQGQSSTGSSGTYTRYQPK